MYPPDLRISVRKIPQYMIYPPLILYFIWILWRWPESSYILLCCASLPPTGGSTCLLTASLVASKQSFIPGPEHLQQKHTFIILSNRSVSYCHTSVDEHLKIHTRSRVSPLCAVVVTGFTVALPVGVLEDEPSVSAIHPSGARRHAVRAVSEVGTRHTLVCTLSGREGQFGVTEPRMKQWSDWLRYCFRLGPASRKHNVI